MWVEETKKGRYKFIERYTGILKIVFHRYITKICTYYYSRNTNKCNVIT